MDATDLTAPKIKHAHSLLRDLKPSENGYHEFVEEAAETLAEVLDDLGIAQEDTEKDTPAQILYLVTNA